jgi:hypothetical protein
MNMVAHRGHKPGVISAGDARILIGLAVMLVGFLMLADRLSWWGFHMNVPLWPWVLFVLGLGRISHRPDGARSISRSGVWLLAIGTWGLLTEYRLLGFAYGRSWPLLVLIVGIFMVWRALDTRTTACAGRESRS